MKKALVIILAVLICAGIAAGIILISRLTSPEYTLKKAIDATGESGLDGLRPYLTDRAWSVVDSVSDTAQSLTESASLSGVAQTAAIGILKREIGSIQWTVDNVLRGDGRADVVLAFDYQGKIQGTVSLIMIKTGGGWKIDSVALPGFDKISLW